MQKIMFAMGLHKLFYLQYSPAPLKNHNMITGYYKGNCQSIQTYKDEMFTTFTQSCSDVSF
mgnify:CR=1 FL=1